MRHSSPPPLSFPTHASSLPYAPVLMTGEGQSPITFETRLDIVVGVAEALNHMHSLTPPVVHRDIKTLNVFMDDKMQVRREEKSLEHDEALM